MKNIQSGESPSLLILSGTHGDEYEVIDLIKKYIDSNKEKIPNYFYIPEVSQSAVFLRTRENKYGNDINRNFKSDAIDPEALSVMDMLREKNFEVCLDFHEDPELKEFYLYDSGQLDEPELHNFQKALEVAGINLYTGVDDIQDPVLGFNFYRGYRSFLGVPIDPTDGTFWDWAEPLGKIKRMVTIEVPGKLNLAEKYKIVELVFENLLQKLYNR